MGDLAVESLERAATTVVTLDAQLGVSDVAPSALHVRVASSRRPALLVSDDELEDAVSQAIGPRDVVGLHGPST